MLAAIKKLIKWLMWNLHLDLTRNMKYDRQTLNIMKSVIKPASNCVDVGCHKGEILELMCRLAPNGRHYAFEPIPTMYKALKEKFATGNASIFPYALSAEKGKSTFNFVVNAPAYSGIKKRRYDRDDAIVEEIDVELEKLDNIIPESEKIDLIKIDVEGAELGVLQGAERILRKHKPVVIFECGLGGSDFYGTKPEQVYDLFDRCGLKISLMSSYLKKEAPLSADEFVEQFNSNSNWYFVAHP